jgi:hypothetical protein
VPEKGKVAQGSGHGDEVERVVCCGRMGTEGLEALIKFRTQSPCFREKKLKMLREEALSEIYFGK